MFVCVCNAVNDRVIKDIVRKENVKTLEELQSRIKICDRCRLCEPTIHDIIQSSSGGR